MDDRVNGLIEENPDLESYRQVLTNGALLANDGGVVTEKHSELYPSDTAKKVEFEKNHPIRSQSSTMFLLALAASFAAVNFGQDESAVGGAQLQFEEEFNIVDSNLQGLVNAAPYLAADVIGSPAASYLDNYLGRRKVVLISYIFGIAGSLWQAFTHRMGSLLAERFFLGIGMGMNSAVADVCGLWCHARKCLQPGSREH